MRRRRLFGWLRFCESFPQILPKISVAFALASCPNPAPFLPLCGEKFDLLN
jgi:hypothetical protein